MYFRSVIFQERECISGKGTRYVEGGLLLYLVMEHCYRCGLLWGVGGNRGGGAISTFKL